MNATSVISRRARVAFFGLAVLALALSGCMPPAVANPPAQATVAPAQPTVAPAPAAEAMVKMAKNDEYGAFLVGDNGMTLYVYTKDEKNVSNCYDQCATNWPVLFTGGAPKAGDGVIASLLGTTSRKDGKLQVTYNGWPLYFWIKDTKVGDTSGQNVGGVWFLVSPNGEMVKTEAAASETPSQAAGALVKMAKNDEYGSFLVGENGMTLYLYTKDEKNVSNCYDQCATNWPVLFTTGAPKAGDGVDASLLGTTTRKDGQMQVTYNGWPLYFWIKDTKVGDTTGQNVGGVWFLVSPQGEMIKEEAASGEAPAPAAKTVQVSIKDFSFGAPLTVAVGTTVEWTNADSAAHTVTDPGGAFDSGNMAQGAKFSFTFTKEGTFNYICSYHPNMKGQVIVTK